MGLLIRFFCGSTTYRIMTYERKEEGETWVRRYGRRWQRINGQGPTARCEAQCNNQEDGQTAFSTY